MPDCCPRSGQSFDYWPSGLERVGTERRLDSSGRLDKSAELYRCNTCGQLFYNVPWVTYTVVFASEQLTRKRHNLGYRRSWIEPPRPTHKTEKRKWWWQ